MLGHSVANDTETRFKDEVNVNGTEPVDEKLQSSFADVTLVCDDRDEEELHQVRNHEPCGSCGRKSHSSHRTSRRKWCPAWNKFCKLCSRRGHFQKVCKAAIEQVEELKEEENDNNLSFGEIAGLGYCLSKI